MRFRSWVIACSFLLLAVHYLTRRGVEVPTGVETGVWSGRVSTVTARGAMIRNLWVSSPDFAGRLDRGDSLLVLGRRRGMYVSPWAVRVKYDGGVFPSFRRALCRRFRAVVPDSVALGLSSAVLLGSRGLVPSYVAETFQLSGTAHLLALSGMHTGIVSAFILLCSRALFGRRRIGSIAAVSAVVAFVLLTGGRPSTVRAGIMAGMVIVWMAFHGGGVHPLSVWCLALAPAAADPSLLADAGAQMSYGAVLSLILFARSWGGIPGRFLTPLWAGVVVITSLAPLCAAVYGSLYPAGAVSTVASVPIMGAVMALGALALTGVGSSLLSWVCRFWIGLLGLFTGYGIGCVPCPETMGAWAGLMVVLFLVKRGKGFGRRFR